MTVKIKLPKSVGEEIVIYVYRAKEELDFGDNDFAEFYKMMMGKIDSATYNYIMTEPIQSDRNQRIINLLNAWVNGWEEE